MDWIPVSERLPEKCCLVLAATDCGRLVLFFWNNTEKWELPYPTAREFDGDVTHWQPLPETPAEVSAPTGEGPQSNPSQP